ncbi:LemA family protein [Streptococcus merionis]|uniref:LemA family protein n=1 Tax=Streptococcus merionis TaxID=400065 RepID=UPI0026F284CB|nr:LemA family protein [Streptococcus merionis]
MAFIVILIILVVLVAWGIGMYNGLVRSRMHTEEAWSQIDVQLKRRNDLIPNLIETVKGYGRYEQETLEKVIKLRNQVASASNPTEKMAASDELTRQVSGLMVVAEAYPDLKASANYTKLQEELTNTENKIAYSRQLFNSTTGNYNAKLQTFPSNLFAKFFGFQPSIFLAIPEEEKMVPKVDFGPNGLGD